MREAMVRGPQKLIGKLIVSGGSTKVYFVGGQKRKGGKGGGQEESGCGPEEGRWVLGVGMVWRRRHKTQQVVVVMVKVKERKERRMVVGRMVIVGQCDKNIRLSPRYKSMNMYIKRKKCVCTRVHTQTHNYLI